MQKHFSYFLTLVGVVLTLGTAPSSFCGTVTINNPTSSTIYFSYKRHTTPSNCSTSEPFDQYIPQHLAPGGSIGQTTAGGWVIHVYADSGWTTFCHEQASGCNDTTTVNLSACGSGATTNYSACVSWGPNRDCLTGIPWQGYVVRNGVATAEPGVSGILAFNTNSVSKATFCYSHTNAFDMIYIYLNHCTNENGLFVYANPTNNVTYNPPTPGPSGVGNGEDGNPADQWRSGTNNNVNDDAIIRAIAEAANRITRQVDSSGDQITSAIGDLEDAMGDLGSGTNSGSSGPTNWVTQQHAEAVTNMANSEGSGSRFGLSMLTAQSTNWNLAFTAGSNALGSDTVATFDTAGGRYVMDTNYSAGSTPALTFLFLEGTPNETLFSFNPNTTFMSNIFNWIYQCNVFVLLVWFGLWGANFVKETIADITHIESGGVPNLEGEFMGVGGNAAGWIVFGIVGVVVCLGFRWFYNTLMERWLGLSQTPDPSTLLGFNGSSMAVWFFVSVFPIGLFLALLSARITLQFAGAKLLALAAAGFRMLPTK